MRLAELSSDIIIGYHATKSYHTVLLIFKHGFKDECGAGRLCFVTNEDMAAQWCSDLGNYLIKFNARADDINYESPSECGIDPSKAHPKNWAIQVGKKLIWQNIPPDEFDPETINTAQLDKYQKYQWNIDFGSDHTTEDIALLSKLGSPWNDYKQLDKFENPNELIKNSIGYER